MTEPFIATGIGSALSADVAVPDQEAEVRFYARVLSTGEYPLWREDDLANNRGIPVIGLGARLEEYAHLPLQWMPHIQVADVGDSVERTVQLGGTVLMNAKDEHGKSQWAVLLDPTGAAFGIIPVIPSEAVGSGDGVGSLDAAEAEGRIVWIDLTVPDASAARDFYQEVIGWSVEEVPMKEGTECYADYNMLGSFGRPAAGVCHARGVNQGLPPVWMLHLPVGDLTESLRRVEEEGGRVLKTMQGSDGAYWYAVIQDPVGVTMALVQE